MINTQGETELSSLDRKIILTRVINNLKGNRRVYWQYEAEMSWCKGETAENMGCNT